VLDQLVAGADPKTGLTYANAVALLGYTDAALLDEVVDALAARDGAAVFELVDRVVESGHDPRRFATDLLERFRDLVVLASVPDAGTKGLIDAPTDLLERMTGQASRFGVAELSRAADVLHTGLTEMRGTTTPRLLLELVCARLLLPAAARDESALLARLDRLERRLEIGGAPAAAASAPAAPARTSAPAPADEAPAPKARRTTKTDAQPVETPAAPAETGAAAPPTAVAPADGQLDAAALRRVWPEVLEATKGRRRTAHALLSQHATVVEVRGRVLVLAFDHAPLLRQFDLGGHSAVLVEALREVLGVEWSVETVSGAAGSAEHETPGAPTSEGFAPGDAPADDEAEGTKSGGSDDAISLLESGLGATVIGEVDST
jgi:DNA polymerase-3 subunit gamma/tau